MLSRNLAKCIHETGDFKMIVNQIIEEIIDHQIIIIHRHVRPDPDALGSQVGLQKMIEKSFPSKQVYAVGEEDPSLYFLARMDQVSDSLYENALVIVCDTANTDRICDQRYNKGKKLIKIDHHPNHEPYGDVQWVSTEASSTSEMIYELYLQAKDADFKISSDVARLLYAGIVGDTGRFLFPSTTNKTFKYSAELITYDFDRTKLYDCLYNLKNNIIRLQGYVLQQFKISKAGVTAIKLTKETLDEYNVSSLESSQLVGILGNIEGLKTWVFFIEEADLIRVRLRSKGPVINKIAAKYNGGGHPLASGATVHSWEEADELIADLEEIATKF